MKVPLLTGFLAPPQNFQFPSYSQTLLTVYSCLLIGYKKRNWAEYVAVQAQLDSLQLQNGALFALVNNTRRCWQFLRRNRGLRGRIWSHTAVNLRDYIYISRRLYLSWPVRSRFWPSSSWWPLAQIITDFSRLEQLRLALLMPSREMWVQTLQTAASYVRTLAVLHLM